MPRRRVDRRLGDEQPAHAGVVRRALARRVHVEHDDRVGARRARPRTRAPSARCASRGAAGRPRSAGRARGCARRPASRRSPSGGGRSRRRPRRPPRSRRGARSAAPAPAKRASPRRAPARSTPTRRATASAAAALRALCSPGTASSTSCHAASGNRRAACGQWRRPRRRVVGDATGARPVGSARPRSSGGAVPHDRRGGGEEVRGTASQLAQRPEACRGGRARRSSAPRSRPAARASSGPTRRPRPPATRRPLHSPLRPLSRGAADQIAGVEPAGAQRADDHRRGRRLAVRPGHRDRATQRASAPPAAARATAPSARARAPPRALGVVGARSPPSRRPRRRPRAGTFSASVADRRLEHAVGSQRDRRNGDSARSDPLTSSRSERCGGTRVRAHAGPSDADEVQRAGPPSLAAARTARAGAHRPADRQHLAATSALPHRGGRGAGRRAPSPRGAPDRRSAARPPRASRAAVELARRLTTIAAPRLLHPAALARWWSPSPPDRAPGSPVVRRPRSRRSSRRPARRRGRRRERLREEVVLEVLAQVIPAAAPRSVPAARPARAARSRAARGSSPRPALRARPR